MGTEILGIFLIVPPLLFVWNIKQFQISEQRTKSIVLMVSGLVFLSYFCVIAYMKGYFMQGLILGSLFYGPFHIASWASVRLILKLISIRAKSQTHVES